MSGRISEQRLNELFEEAESDSDEESAFGEIMDHRRRETALLLELRALAEQIREPVLYQHFVHPEFVHGAHTVRARILVKIDSLLDAHDAQQAEGK